MYSSPLAIYEDRIDCPLRWRLQALLDFVEDFGLVNLLAFVPSAEG